MQPRSGHGRRRHARASLLATLAVVASTAALGFATNLVSSDSILTAAWAKRPGPVLTVFLVSLAAVLGFTVIHSRVNTGARRSGRRPLRDGPLAVLLRAQVAAGRSFPYRLSGSARVDLADAYVRQRITRPDGGTDGEEDSGAPVESVESVLARHRHVVVTGGPGCGKSTMTLRLVATVSAALLDESRRTTALLPIRVSARALADRAGDAFTASLAAVLAAELGAHLDEVIAEDLLAEPPTGITWLVVVDGLDEIVDGEARDGLLAVLRQRMGDDDDRYRFLLTSRLAPPGLHDLPQVGWYEMAPFAPEQLRDFARRWFHDTAAPAASAPLAEAFLEQVRRTGLAELASVPLLATVAAVVFEERPGKGLPRSRHELFELYVSLLYQARARSADEGLRARLQGWPDGDELARWLSDHRAELVEHLAVTWLANSPLRPAALDWVRAHGPTPPALPPDWAEVVVVTATSTGLVVPVGGDLQFTHQAFAEHLAARAAVRRLPAHFDGDDAGWGYHLAEATRAPGGLSYLALVQYGFYRGGDDILDWLAAGGSDEVVLAARLLAEGIHASNRQYRNFAEVLRFWLRRARRQSAHDPQLLVVIRLIPQIPAHRDLVTALTDELAEPSLAAATRIELLDALTALGGRHVTTAARQLAELGTDIRTALPLRLRVARLLLGLGPAGQALAVTVLASITGAHRTSPEWQEAELLLRTLAAPPAAASLAQRPEADPQTSELGRADRTGTAMLRRITRTASWARLVRLLWHVAAWVWEPDTITREHRRRLVWAQRYAVVPNSRERTARALADVERDLASPWAYQLAESVVRLARAVGDHPDAIPPSVRRLVIDGALPLGPLLDGLTAIRTSSAGLLTLVLHRLADRPEPVAEDAPVRTLHAIARRHPGLRPTVAGLLVRVITNEPVEHRQRLAACRLLRDLAPTTCPDVRRTLLDKVRPGSPPLAHVLEVAGELDPADGRDVLDLLWQLSTQSTVDDHQALTAAAVTVAEAYPDLRPETGELVTGLTGPSAPSEQRLTAAHALIRLGGPHQQRGVEVLANLAGSVGVTVPTALAAARALARIDPAPRQPIATAYWRAVDQAEGVSARVALAAELARADASSRQAVSTYLGGLVADATLPFPARVSAVRALGQLGPAARATALALLPQFAAGTVADLPQRWDFAQELSFWSREFQAAAADFLDDLAAALPGPDAAHTAWQLITLNEPDHERAADILRRIGQRSAEPAGVHALAAKKLAQLGPQYRPEGIDRLRELSRNQRPEHLTVTVLWELAFLDDVDYAVAQLAAIAVDPACAVPTRTKAARTMLMLKSDCPPESVQALRMMVEDPSLPEVDRSWVREALVYFGLVPV